jgi:glycosyltransferase involved in cell wall biosynthesis
MNQFNISLIIPTYNCQNELKVLLNSVLNQSHQPNEIIIVDSSSHHEIKDYLDSFQNNIPIFYIRSSKKYPGEKRNEGAKAASYNWLAFLDVGTVPRSDWLERNIYLAKKNKTNVVFGCTKYRAITRTQKLLRAATFGRVGHETSPGTLVSLDIFNQSGGFIEGIRAGDDQEWRLQLRDISSKCVIPVDPSLDYLLLPNTFFGMQKKYFIYYLFSAKVRAQKKIRDIYLCAFLVFSMLLLTKWNYLIGGWDSNILFIPNITKIFASSLIVVLFVYIIISRAFEVEGRFNLLNWFAKVLLFTVVSLTVYKWNTNVIDWVEDSIFFVPHITKKYILLLFIISFFYRGVYIPLKLGIGYKFIFPGNWIVIGLIGLSFDLLKTPGIMLGIILAPFQKKLSKL